ncbi:MAG: TraR/DksA family transcriptional regulator [Bryobacteraceae bacterium]
MKNRLEQIEAAMTKIERNGFRKVLEARQAELVLGRSTRDAFAIEASPDELDRIQNAQERELAIGASDRGSKGLREVETALKRVGTDAFGVCANCGEEISAKRIAVVPWALYCITCQEAADNAAKEPWDSNTFADAA